MSKVVYTSEPMGFNWRHVLPWCILQDLLKHRRLIWAMTLQNFRATYQASHLGIAWQILLPMIMLGIYYFVFGRILGGRFMHNGTETSIDYALALFVGLGFFNFIAQNIGSASSILPSNVAYVKTLSFPLETLPVISVLGVLLNLLIGLMLVLLVFFGAKGHVYASAIITPFYVVCIFLIALGISWGISAIAVFIRDITAITSPITLILMFMCPIFYPASMVPAKMRWVIDTNPLSVIIENSRDCLLYGRWPSLSSVAANAVVSLLIAIIGYFIFIRAKSAFADVM